MQRQIIEHIESVFILCDMDIKGVTLKTVCYPEAIDCKGLFIFPGRQKRLSFIAVDAVIVFDGPVRNIDSFREVDFV